MPRREIRLATILTALLLTCSSSCADNPKTEELPIAWSEKDHPIRTAATHFTMMKLANDAEITRDLGMLARWRRPNSEFMKRVRENKAIRVIDSPGEIDELLAQTWQEIRLGHPNSKIDALPFNKPLKDEHLSVVDDLVLVRFETKPTGAQILVDGAPKRTTNRSLGLNPKAVYKIELKKDCFPDFKNEKYKPKPGDKIFHDFGK